MTREMRARRESTGFHAATHTAPVDGASSAARTTFVGSACEANTVRDPENLLDMDKHDIKKCHRSDKTGGAARYGGESE